MIQIKNLSFGYDDTILFNDFSMNIKPKEHTVILGPSGCGKTTLLNLISGVTDSFRGKIVSKASKYSYIFQEDRLIEWMTVEENCKIVKEDLDNSYLDQILEILHIKQLKDKQVKHLSGGQKQRVSIARAFVYDPDFILLDEPFKSLDIFIKNKLIEDLIKLSSSRNIPWLLVTHDPREAFLLADRVFLVGNRPLEIVKEITLKLDFDDRKNYREKFLDFENSILREMATT